MTFYEEQNKNIKMYKPQRIRDPLHNLIEFKAEEFEDAMWKVLNTRPFQRLRRIKQLGFSDLVYPGATHSRFVHSVGVFHTARQLMEIVEEHLGKTSFKETMAKKSLAAALVHDVGHGPFSHAFESVGKRLNLKMARHENVSDAIIRDSEITEVLAKNLGNGFAGEVADLIGNKGSSDIYSAVVSSQFDADRLDYMQRDRLMAGTQNGAIDFRWLMANLLVGEVPLVVDDKIVSQVETFVLGPKAIYAAESYVLGLFQLYPTLYFHKTTRCAEKLFVELLFRVISLIQGGQLAATGLHEKHPIVRFAQNPDSLDNVLSLDDTVMWGAIYQFVDAPDAAISELAVRLRDRNLYKCIDIINDVDSIVKDRETTEKTGISIRQKIIEWCKQKGGDVPRILYDETKRSPYNKLDESKGPINQIHILDTTGTLVDIDQVSDAVRAIKEFPVFRVYTSPEDAEAIKFIKDTVYEEAKNATSK